MRNLFGVAVGVALVIALVGAAAGDALRDEPAHYAAGVYASHLGLQGTVVFADLYVSRGEITAGRVMFAPETTCLDNPGGGRQSVALDSVDLGHARVSRDGQFRADPVADVNGTAVSVPVTIAGALSGASARLTVDVAAFSVTRDHARCPGSRSRLVVSIEATRGSLTQFGTGPIEFNVRPIGAYVGQPFWFEATAVDAHELKEAGIASLLIWATKAACSEPVRPFRTPPFSASTKFDDVERFTFAKPGQYFLCVDALDHQGREPLMPGVPVEPWSLRPLVVCGSSATLALRRGSLSWRCK